jgi:hypothetical protein
MEINFNDLFNKYKNNKLIIPIIYQLLDNNEEKKKIIKTFKNIYKFKNLNHQIIIKIILLLINAINIIANLPFILNKTMYKNKPSLHIIFSEATAQLISVILFSEIFLYILKLKTTSENKIKILKKINNIQNNYNKKLIIVNNKIEIKNFYNDFINNIINLTKKLITILQ